MNSGENAIFYDDNALGCQHLLPHRRVVGLNAPDFISSGETRVDRPIHRQTSFRRSGRNSNSFTKKSVNGATVAAEKW